MAQNNLISGGMSKVLRSAQHDKKVMESNNPMEFHRDDEPIFVISVAARLLQVHPQTLRYYERAGLLKPTRSSGKIRLYSQKEIERLRKIQRLTNELGVNLAGVEIIIDLTERLENLQAQMEKREEALTAEIERLRQELDRLQ